MEFSGVTIDPGQFTAFAVWDKNKLKDIFTYDLSAHSDAARISILRHKLCFALEIKGSMVAVIEDQALWAASAKSFASGTSGAIFTTAKIAGALALFFKQVEFVQPIKWKGNMNNTQLRRVLKLKFGFEANNDHEANAYGIGLWKQGKM